MSQYSDDVMLNTFCRSLTVECAYYGFPAKFTCAMMMQYDAWRFTGSVKTTLPTGGVYVYHDLTASQVSHIYKDHEEAFVAYIESVLEELLETLLIQLRQSVALYVTQNQFKDHSAEEVVSNMPVGYHQFP